MNEHDFRELSAARALHALTPDEDRALAAALAAHPEWRDILDADLATAAGIAERSPEVPPPAGSRAALLAAIARTPQLPAPDHRDTVSYLADPSDEMQRVPSADGIADPTAADLDAFAQQLADDARGDRADGDRTDGAADEADDNAGAPADTAADTPADAAAATPRRRRAGWYGLAASVALLLALGITLPLRGMAPPEDPVSVALEQVEQAPDAQTASARVGDSGTATLRWSDTAEQAVFTTEGMAAAPSDRDYELWIVRGDQPISLGVMRTTADGTAAVLARGFEPGDALAITVEQAGGSPTGAPTTDPIVVVASA